jgi:hypothetical protein
LDARQPPRVRNHPRPVLTLRRLERFHRYGDSRLATVHGKTDDDSIHWKLARLAALSGAVVAASFLSAVYGSTSARNEAAILKGSSAHRRPSPAKVGLETLQQSRVGVTDRYFNG